MRISDWSSDVCSSDLPGGGYRSFGSKARNRGLRAPSPALPRWFPTPMARSMRLGVTPSLPDDRRCDSILSFWVPIAHTPCPDLTRSEEHTSELQSLMRISYAVFCLKKKNQESQRINTHDDSTIQIQ